MKPDFRYDDLVFEIEQRIKWNKKVLDNNPNIENAEFLKGQIDFAEFLLREVVEKQKHTVR